MDIRGWTNSSSSQLGSTRGSDLMTRIGNFIVGFVVVAIITNILITMHNNHDYLGGLFYVINP